MAYNLIQTQTVSTAVPSITFSSIPQGYTDLYLVISARSSFATGSVSDLYVYFNGTTTGYTSRWLQGNGASASSSTSTAPADPLVTMANVAANTFNSVSVYIPNYAGSANKSYTLDDVTEDNSTTAYQRIVASLWSNTAAITSLTVSEANGANLVTGSTASLYGIN